MARTPSITLKDVADTVSDLVVKGHKPTIAKVREMLGNKGSPNTISKFLKQLKSDSAASEQVVTAKQSELKLQQKVEVKQVSEFQADDPTSQEIKVEFEPDAHSGGSHQADQGRHRQNKHKQFHQGQNKHRNPHSQQKQKPQKPQKFIRKTQPVLPVEMEVGIYQTENLETLSEEQLVSKIRRLETILNKEQFRRESAESMAAEAKDYAETIKEQVGARINDVKESMDMVVANLQNQIKTAKQDSEKDLSFYREHLAKANKKIQELSSKS